VSRRLRPVVSATRGALSVTAAAALFGSLVVLGKFPATPPLVVALWMNVFAGIAFLPFLLRHRFRREDAPLIVAIGLFGGALAPTLFLLGLSLTTSVTAAFLTTTEAVFTMAIAFGLGERSSVRGYLAMAGLLVGVAVIVTNLDFGQLSLVGAVVGNLLILGATLSWSVDNNVSRVLSRRNAVPALVSAKCLLASAFLLPAVAVTGSSPAFVPTDLSLLLFIGIVVHGVAIWLFYIGLREIGAMRTAALFTLTAVFGVAGGLIAFRDPVSTVQWVAGAAMVALALVLALETASPPWRREPPPEGKTLTKTHQ